MLDTVLRFRKSQTGAQVATTNNSRFGEQAGTMELLWGPRPQPTRGPKPALSIDRIAQAAIAVADAEGLAAVSMQRVAAELGVTKMALYRYVPGKADLIALMVDTAGDPPPLLDGEADGWRAQLGHWARRLLALYQRHPWLLEATVGPRIMGPNEFGWLEQAVAALDGTGLDGGEQMDAVVVILGHVRTIAQQSQAPPGPPQDQPEQQFGTVIAELLAAHGDRYPAVATALASASRPGSPDRALEFGLERIFDGLGVLIAQRARTDKHGRKQ
jgi:AcrR family transcriptional regulator